MIKLAFMGDTFCKTKDDKDPFRFVQPLLADADIRCLNLETALTEIPYSSQKHIRIRTNPENAKYLQSANIDVVHLDNNHTFDCGIDGYADTRATLELRGIKYIERNNPVFLERKKLKFAFIGFRLFEDSDTYSLWKQVYLLSKYCDVVVVSLHWGEEHMPIPSPRQIRIAHNLVRAGANIIVGHHPHCIQGIEKYHDGLIAYSLGNFNFWQEDIETKWYNRLAPILKVSVNQDGNVFAYQTEFCQINEEYAPSPVRKRWELWMLEYKLNRAIGTYTEDKWYDLLGYQYVTQTLKSSRIAIGRHRLNPLWRLVKWLCRTHTHKAIAGMIRAGKINRWKQYTENLATG